MEVVSPLESTLKCVLKKVLYIPTAGMCTTAALSKQDNEKASRAVSFQCADIHALCWRLPVINATPGRGRKQLLTEMRLIDKQTTFTSVNR